jgi:TolB-like protein
VLLIGMALWWALPDRSTGAFIPMARSVAVLPFADMTAPGNQAWFGDGMAEGIISMLARQRQLQVTARTSSFAFKDRPGATIDDIARALKVAYVLEGSVRLEGERVRITAQIIETVTSTFAVLDGLSRKMSADSVSASCATEVVPSVYMKRLRADARWAAFLATVDEVYPVARAPQEAEAAADL